MVNQNNELLISRLINFKFASALAYIDGENTKVIELVQILAEQYGDVGWISGSTGSLINFALRGIGIDNDVDY